MSRKLFDITRHNRGVGPIEGPVTTVMADGLAVAYKSDGSGELVAASGSNFRGHLMREVVASLALEDRVFQTPFEYPYTVGERCSARDGEEVEMEGAALIKPSGGTNYIDENTAIGVNCTFEAGKLVTHDATSAEVAYYQIVAKPAVIDSGSAVRVRLARIHGAGINA